MIHMFQSCLNLGFWQPIQDCPGRYTCTNNELNRIIPSMLVQSLPVAFNPQDLTRGDLNSLKARDSIIAIRFTDGSGGIICYRHHSPQSEAPFLHTLCNDSGFERKLRQLGLYDQVFI